MLLHYKRTILIGFLFSIVFLVTVITVSTYREQYAKYRGFSETLNKNGYVAGYELMSLISIKEQYGYEKFFMDKANKVEDIQYSLSSDIVLDGDKSVKVIGYGDMMGEYAPKLSSGIWYKNAAKQPGEINASVSPNYQGIECGDLIQFEDKNGDTIGIRICGVLENKASYFNIGSYSSPLDIYGLYDVFDMSDFGKNEPTIYMSKEDLEEHIGGIEGLTVFMTLSDNFTAKDKEKFERYYTSRGASLQTYSDVKENSMITLRSKLYMVVPICISVFVLLLASIVCISSLGVVDDLRTMAVIFVTGVSEGKLTVIKCFDALVGNIIGVALLFIYHKCLVSSKYKNMILLELNGYTYAAILAEIIMFVLLSAVITLAILKANSPKKILNDSRM